MKMTESETTTILEFSALHQPQTQLFFSFFLVRECDVFIGMSFLLQLVLLPIITYTKEV